MKLVIIFTEMSIQKRRRSHLLTLRSRTYNPAESGAVDLPGQGRTVGVEWDCEAHHEAGAVDVHNSVLNC